MQNILCKYIWLFHWMKKLIKNTKITDLLEIYEAIWQNNNKEIHNKVLQDEEEKIRKNNTKTSPLEKQHEKINISMPLKKHKRFLTGKNKNWERESSYTSEVRATDPQIPMRHLEPKHAWV